MGSYRITIDGVGTHGGIGGACADQLARELVLGLRSKGHSIIRAEFALTDYEGDAYQVRAGTVEDIHATTAGGDLTIKARRMFEAYNEHAGGRTWDNKPTPPWDELNDAVRSHWVAAAGAA